jgi:hypothetical protein
VSENWKIQVSPKLTDGTLINLRAETPEEAEALFQWAFNKADAIIKTVGAFAAVNNVASGLGGQVVQQETSQQGSWSQQGSGQTQQQAPAQSGEGKRCAHGEMTYREGVGKGSGKPYKAYFCPAPRGTNQCAPEFVR